MDYKSWTIEQLLERRAQIAKEIDGEGVDLDALEEEARAINEELERRRSAEAKREEIRKAVADGAGVTVRKIVAEDAPKPKTAEEVRSSKAYIDAFARYIKTGDDSECRKLLSTNSDVEGNPGQVPVPTYIEGRIRTNWEKVGLMNLVRKTYIRGNLQVGFELSATGAVIHKEGTDAPPEEALTFGVVTLVPESIKKWIRISDEAMDMGGQDFLDYIYDEITYQIAKKAEQVLIDKIEAAPAASTATAVGQPVIAGTPSLDVIAKAIAALSDQADNPVIVMNKATYAAFRTAQVEGNFAVDPFEGLTVHFCNYLATYAAASASESAKTWMIVGDFGRGAQANFPNGGEIRIKYDDLSEAESDLVKFVGREYVAIGVVAENHFVKVQASAG